MQMLNTPVLINPRLLRNLVVGMTSFAQADDLHSSLVPRFARQRSHVCWFHSVNMGAHTENSSSFIPNQ
uniref:Uncharacterized protein n=1 Tax=blood disease bacterium R229 TaxID=741978 RepID=G2ZRZ6_9RALS|nr:exported hypothetical protein [blood disease bacterium R229]